MGLDYCHKNRGRVRHPTKQALRGPRKRPRPQHSMVKRVWRPERRRGGAINN